MPCRQTLPACSLLATLPAALKAPLGQNGQPHHACKRQAMPRASLASVPPSKSRHSPGREEACSSRFAVQSVVAMLFSQCPGVHPLTAFRRAATQVCIASHMRLCRPRLQAIYMTATHPPENSGNNRERHVNIEPLTRAMLQASVRPRPSSSSAGLPKKLMIVAGTVRSKHHCT